MKKIAIACENIKEYENLLRCPQCGNGFRLESRMLRCCRNHCYDLSAKGYVNFLGGIQTEYPRSLFLSRREVFRAGFFELVCQTIVKMLGATDRDEGDTVFVLDAGCGEGSTLAAAVQSSHKGKRLLGIGLDISKEAIALATDMMRDHIWMVGDLAKVPLVEGSMDFVLNVLSPANYSEFRRLLKKDGLLIKVVPEAFHLRELRSVFYGQDRYDNSQTWEHLTKNVGIVSQERLTYTFPVDLDLLGHIVAMTPLSNHVEDTKKEKVAGLGIRGVTCDVAIVLAMV